MQPYLKLISTVKNDIKRQTILNVDNTLMVLRSLVPPGLYSTKGGQPPGSPVDCQIRYLIPVKPHPLTSTSTVYCQSVQGRTGRLLPSIGFQLVACLAIFRESNLMTCLAHLSLLSLMMSSNIAC